MLLLIMAGGEARLCPLPRTRCGDCFVCAFLCPPDVFAGGGPILLPYDHIRGSPINHRSHRVDERRDQPSRREGGWERLGTL